MANAVMGLTPQQIKELAKPLASDPLTTLTWVRLHPEASEPFLAYDESAAYDLSLCAISDNGRPNNVILPPNFTKIFPTGIALRPPAGHLILICSRSGMAQKSVFVSNAPGVIDPTYTGEIKVLLFNGGTNSMHFKHGDRIAQALVVPFAKVKLELAQALPETIRGDKGFGSSGMGGPNV
jgi:dUTP pyrophosphatase